MATAGRAAMIDRVMPWIVGNLVVIALFARDLHALDGGIVAGEAFWGRDFINVWTAGRLVLEGRLEVLYDLPAYADFARTLFGRIGDHNFSYPPLVLPLLVPFALLPYPVALAAWLGATGWLFVRAAGPWWRDATGLPAWLAVLTPAAVLNVWAGHYGFLIGALFLFGFRNLERGRPVRAGVFFGLMVVKPHLAVLVPLILLIRRDWPAVAAAAGTVAALVGGSVLMFGTGLWWEYLTVTTRAQAAMIDPGGAFFGLMSTSVATAAFQLGATEGLAAALQTASAVLAAGMVAVAAARRAPIRSLATLAATATFLVLPYAFNYDLVVSALGAGMILMSGREKTTALRRRLALCGFAAAQLGMVLIALGLPGIPLLLWLLMGVQFRLAMRNAPYRSRRPSSPKNAINDRVVPANGAGARSA